MPSNVSDVVMVDVPITLRVAVSFPGGPPPDEAKAAEELALKAAQHLTHVSRERLQAFNAVNRILTEDVGEVRSVITTDLADGVA